MNKKIFNNLEEYILMFLLVSISFLLGFQIIFRYVIKSSLSWSEELVRFLFIWTTFICVPYTIKNKGMLNISIFINTRDYETQAILIRIVNIIMIVIFTILAYFSMKLVIQTYELNQRTPAIGLPLWSMYISVFFGSLLSIIRIIEKSKGDKIW